MNTVPQAVLDARQREDYYGEQEAMLATPLLREEFVTWLESLPPKAMLGYVNDCHLCPLAEWLKFKFGLRETYSDDYLQVDGERWTPVGWFRAADLPEWAKQFAQALDTVLSDAAAPVTARLCIRILETI